MTGNNWSDHELYETLKVYMEMLSLEKAGRKYNKSAFRRELLAGPLVTRNNQSIERRMQNISFFLEKNGRERIQGYKPLSNLGAGVEVRLEKLLDIYELGGQSERSAGLQEPDKVIDSSESRGPNPRIAGYTVNPTDPTSTTAVTYIAQYGFTSVFKFGWTRDLDERLSDLNKHIPNEDEIPGQPKWHFRFHSHRLYTEEAHKTEQEIGASLGPYRTTGERFVCSESVLNSLASEFNLSPLI